MHSPKEHFHTYLQSLDAERAGLPDEFRDKLARVLRHYGVDRLRAHARSSRRPSSGSSSRSSAPPRRSTLATSHPAALARRARSRRAAARRRGTRRARPARRGDPAALPRRRRPRPQRALPLVRPAARRPGTGERPRRGERPPRRPGRRARRTRPRRSASTSSPRSPSRSCASSLTGCTRMPGGLPDHEPMLEVLIRRHYREHELHGLHTFRAGGRPFAVADYTLDDRPTHLTSTIGAASRARAGQRPRHGRLGRRLGPARGPSLRRRPLPQLAGRAGVARRGEPTGSPGCCRRCRSPGTPVASRSRRARWRSAGLLLHLPSRRGGPRRGPPRTRGAPDGRPPAQPLAPDGTSR